MSDHNTVLFAIQPARSVLRDTLLNKKWILWIIIMLLAWILVSSIAFDFGQCAAGRTCTGFGDSLYFTAINVTTVGFGDIHPESGWMKILASVNAFIGMVAFGFFVAVLASALQPSSFSGTINTGTPPTSDWSASSPNEDRTGQSKEATALRFLDALGALMANENHPSREAHIRLQVPPGEDRSAQVMVHVWVKPW